MNAPVPEHASAWNLRFLSGPMYGRTMWLRLGENWVGTGADCEVILPDRDIAVRQLCLNVGTIAVTVQNFGGAPATINSEVLGEVRRALMPDDIVQVGSIRLGVLHTAASVPLAEPARADAQRRRASWLALAGGFADRVGQRRFLIGLAVLWAAVALAAGGYFAVASHAFVPWGHVPQFVRMRAVQQALRPYPELVVKPDGNDGLVISGYVRTEADRKALPAIAARFDEVVVGDTFIVEDLLATARQYFSDTPLKVSYGGSGRIVLSGDASRQAVAQRIGNFMQDARPAVQVIDRVHYQGDGPLRFAHGDAANGIPDIVGVFDDGQSMRFIETRDGQRYFEGAQLKGGLRVISISAARVLFDKDGKQLKMPLGPPLDTAPAQPASQAASAPGAASPAPPRHDSTGGIGMPPAVTSGAASGVVHAAPGAVHRAASPPTSGTLLNHAERFS